MFKKSVTLRNIALLAMLCVHGFTISTAFADNEVNDNFDQLLEQHENNPKIKAAIPRLFPPFYFTDNENIPYGMAIEVLNEIDHHAGFLTEFDIKENWKQVFKSIDNNEAQIIPNLGITEERRQKYLFTRPYATTRINLFIRNVGKVPKRLDKKSLKTGVVENNAGVKIARENGYTNLTVFPDLESLLHALADKKIDAFIYPRVIAIREAKDLKLFNAIQDTGITLKKIERAIAVNKNYPEIRQQLDKALEKYLQTQNYSDTYNAWYGVDQTGFKTSHLIILDLLVLVLCSSYFIFLWNNRKISSIKKDGSRPMDVIWMVTLISILVITSILISVITLTVLYHTSYDEQRQRLIDITKSRTRLIEEIARFNLQEHQQSSISDPDIAYKNIIKQIRAAHNKFRGFGKTGEFVMASLNKEKKEIHFILRQRHSNFSSSINIPFAAQLAIPMKMALLGHSGTIEAVDYRGEKVLAAYEPIDILGMGIVAKLDIREIRKPYLDAALIIMAIVIVIATFGSILFFKILQPLFNRINVSEKRFYQFFINTQTPVLLINPKTLRIIDANIAASDFYGYPNRESMLHNLSILYPDNSDEMQNQLTLATSDMQVFQTKHRMNSGKIKIVEVTSNVVELENETVISFVVNDITEKLEHEKQQKMTQKNLEQARKMEALGQLTGGIAHDFNNMLGVIMGYASLSLDKIKSNNTEKISDYLEQVLLASNRAKSLISSMMIFSRTDETQAHPIKLAPLVKENIKMMRSIIPTSIKINSHIDESLPATLIEPVKLQQLVMNLCINARDAMDGQGLLTIKLSWYINTGENCRLCFENISGEWIELSIQDNGTGMTAETLEHIFEPFYTTKVQGKGTGMGMSVVHGIVSDLAGHALVTSSPGKGTRVSILFKPQAEETVPESDEAVLPEESAHEKCILIVDDESSIAELYKSILEDSGYQCRSFSSSVTALDHFNNHAEKYDLIISDQTMPEITGFQLIIAARKIKPEIPAIISTGYNENFNESIARKNNIVFLAKPVSKDVLNKVVNKIFS